jgi:hypothetical protein
MHTSLAIEKGKTYSRSDERTTDTSMTPIETAIATTTIKSASGPASNALAHWGKKKYDKFVATYTNALSEYVNESIKICESVKNILYRRNVASTDEKYVNVSFRRNGEKIKDSSIISALTLGRHVMIKGRGGAGKTMFTKWSVLRIVETVLHHQKIPIFIELREIRVDKDFDLFEDYIFDKISNNRTKTNKNQFMEGLKAGLFILILDAADEIKKTRRHEILKKISAFERQFPETAILLTTREFPEVDTMTGFEVYETMPLSQSQALEILKKLDYREDIKNPLISDIKEGKYKKHSFFLENPLLVTILLLTFDQSRDIPTKRSAFYRRAFETLYERHDGSKENSFARDHHAGLPMEDFEVVFSIFCYGTYINSIYEFEDRDLTKFFKAALDEAGIDADGDQVARDSIESACLLTKEGHDIVFVHRSFQEYFTALYIKNYKGPDLGDVIAEAFQNGHGENTLEFVYELDQSSFEKKYVLPRLRKINNRFEKHSNTDGGGSLKIMADLVERFSISGESGDFRGLRFTRLNDTGFLLNIASIYPEANLLRVFTEYNDREYPVFFGAFSMSELAGMKNVTRRELSHGELVYDVKFTPDAKDWFLSTEYPERLSKYARDLKSLEVRLARSNRPQDSKVRKRFNKFTKD